MEVNFSAILNRAVDRVDRRTLANSDPRIIIVGKLFEDLKLSGIRSVSDRIYDGEIIEIDTILDFFEARHTIATEEIIKKRDLLFDYFERILREISEKLDRSSDPNKRLIYEELFNRLVEEIDRD